MSYEEMWNADLRQHEITTINNISADIAAGYDILGENIRGQFDELFVYVKAEERRAYRAVCDMDAEQAEKWFRKDLIRKGAISE